MLRSSRTVLSGEPYSRHAGKSVTESPPYCHPVGRMRAQEVLAARLAPPATAVPMPPRQWISGSGPRHAGKSLQARNVRTVVPTLSAKADVTPCRRSARIAAQSTVATYMADGSVVRVPRVVPVTVTVRCSLSRSNTYADHEYGERAPRTMLECCDAIRQLLNDTNEPGICTATKQSRIHTLFRYVEKHGHLLLWNNDSFRRTVVDKAREFRRQLTFASELSASEYHSLRACLSRVAKTFQ